MSNNVNTGTGTGTGKTPYFEVTAQVETATTYAEQIIKTEAYRMEKRFADGVKGLHVYGAKVTDGAQIAKLICSVA
nr:MAG TPA: Major capsid protein [Caudoviricetes sp.]